MSRALGIEIQCAGGCYSASYRVLVLTDMLRLACHLCHLPSAQRSSGDLGVVAVAVGDGGYGCRLDEAYCAATCTMP
jgi:hypothetical protein